MMKKLGAGLFEVMGLAVTAVLFTLALWVARIPAPVRRWPGSGLAESDADGVAPELERLLLARGPWIAGIGLAAAVAASLLRGDLKRIVAGLRIVAAAGALLFALWAFLGLPAERMPHAWNSLFVAASANLVLTAFLIGGGKGGGASKSKPAADK